jgi:transcription antitermination factor NusG
MQRGMESFLPLMTRVSQWKHCHKRIDYPLFPGYCFARFSDAQRFLIFQSPSVVEIIGNRLGRPEPIPDSEIIAIQQVISSRHTYKPYPQLAKGMGVQVIRGPLMGLQGSLLKTLEGCRLIVAINLIGQGAAVHIDEDDIAPVDSSLSLGSPAIVMLPSL